jgi:sarcosine oxidase subunit gamma
VLVRERADLAIHFVAARDGQAAALSEAVSASIGLGLPDPSRRCELGELSAVSIGPEQWLLLMPLRRAGDMGQALRTACAGLATLVEVGDGRGVIEVSGPRARDALAKGIPVDLHPRAFGPGRTASTMAGLIDMTLSQIDDAPTFQIILFRSLAGSFWHWLDGAAAEFGLAATPSA